MAASQESVTLTQGGTLNIADGSDVVGVASSQKIRLHHLDWFRVLFIIFAVYLHIWQSYSDISKAEDLTTALDNVMIEVFNVSSTANGHTEAYWDLRQNLPESEWRNGYDVRLIAVGRQFVIPLLFWISGYALGLGKEKAISSLWKIALITVLGIGVNAIVYALGPMDDGCSYHNSRGKNQEYCAGKNSIISFGVGTGNGLFSILFQFWFTVFLMVFLAQMHPLCEALREMHASTQNEPWDGAGPAAVKCGIYWVITSIVYIAFMWLWNDGAPSRVGAAFVLAAAELPFIAALAGTALTPSERPQLCRLLQYLAGVLATLQFCLVPMAPTESLDGGMIAYFHLFKQFYLIGFVMALTRHKTAPVVYRAYILAYAALIFLRPPTNYYRSGVDTYPYFPFFLDRFMWTAGGMVQVFIHDRLGLLTAGTLVPVPPGASMGALLTYVLHVPLMVLLAPLADQQWNSAVITFLIFVIFATPFAILESRKKN